MAKKVFFNETQEVRKNMWLKICVKDWCIWLQLLISKHSMWKYMYLKCIYVFVVSLSVDNFNFIILLSLKYFTDLNYSAHSFDNFLYSSILLCLCLSLKLLMCCCLN